MKPLQRSILGVFCGGILLCSPACADEVKPGLDVLVFVDETGSTTRQFDMYRHALLDKIVPNLHGGDRLRVVPITADNSMVVDYMAEGALNAKPPFDSLSDNEIEYKSSVKKIEADNAAVRHDLLVKLRGVLAKPGSSRYTDLFGATHFAAQVFSADKNRPVVVFLSDMQEDRGRFRYKDMKWNARDLARVKRIYGFPDLKNVCVYVVGLRSPSIQKTREMRVFWENYFKQSQADIAKAHMTSMLVDWPPPDGCGSPRVVHKREGWFKHMTRQLGF